MKRNKIVSILEYSARNKMLVGILVVSLIGAGGVFLSSNASISNNTMGINKTVLAGTVNNSGNKACVINGNDSLVLYTSASNSNIQSYISVGEMLTINSYSNGYYNVTVQETGATGYISSSDMQKIVSGVEDNLTSLSGTAYTTNVSTMVNLREEATMNSTTFAKLKNNTSITLLGKQGDWYKVSYNGTTGYIYGEYIAIANSNTNSSAINNTSSSSNTIIASKSTNSSASITETNNSKVIGSTNSNNSLSTSNNSTKAVKTASNKKYSSPHTVSNYDGNESYKIATVNSKIVNVRESANINSSIICKLNKNVEVEVLGEDNGWYKIADGNNQIGYIYHTYLNVGSKTYYSPDVGGHVNNMNQGGIPDTKVINSNDGKLSSNTANKKISSKKVNTNYVYIRVPRGENLHVYSTQNDTNSNTVATLNGGVIKVYILSQSKDWSYITTDNVSGYVLTSALKAAENDYINNSNATNNKFYGGTPIKIPRGENLHIYSTQNDSNSNTVATLNGGIYKVDIQNEGNGWSYIETTNNDNVSGYVLTSALKAAENNYKNSL